MGRYSLKKTESLSSFLTGHRPNDEEVGDRRRGKDGPDTSGASGASGARDVFEPGAFSFTLTTIPYSSGRDVLNVPSCSLLIECGDE